ncbi:uncharacterized protein TNCT_493301 [Trichonephila clavata]|uniref:Uncharacterized protein n=1 Tax=Trichonephila clavata TaxID=2740835 RepID=A0A8X6F503_TRICU|nr:uncharacterized protein TNCT_493301 [Trichonephila clavata]
MLKLFGDQTILLDDGYLLKAPLGRFEINPKYRFLLDDTQEIPVVYSIGDIPNDAEKGMFWTLHVASTSNQPRSYLGRLIPYQGNIKHLLPKAGDELIFWMKPI